MRNIFFATALAFVMSLSAFAQSTDEQEITKIHRGLEQAYVKKDIAVFETALAEYYTFSGPSGKVQTRSDLLKEIRDEIAKPSFKDISEVSDDLKVHVADNGAYVTARWTSVSQGLEKTDEPHTDKGQYTGIYEKSNGKWMLIREVFTEQQHDKKVMEAEVLKASDAFDAAMRTRDKTAYERMLHADYIYTSNEGELITRAEDLNHFAKVTIKSVEATEKKVRVIGNNAAVETGIYHAVGAHDGKPFDETGRYTTTWIWKDLRWQVIADHSSLVKK